MGGQKFRKKVFRPEGVTVVVSDDCDLLGDCAVPDVCSVDAVSLGPSKAEIDLEKCVGCGHCVQVCPIEAISFEFDPEVDIVGELISKVETYTTIT
jgi:dissimilatory sulfite reductase (desulfoviridin) alpha/beta subunit